MDGKRFAKGTERLVDPVTVGSIHFLQQFFGLLPLGVQRALLERSSKASSHMGFVVEPYAFFLAYRVADEQRASALLPKGFKLAKSRLFEGDEEACYAILSFFRVHTSAFWGLRQLDHRRLPERHRELRPNSRPARPLRAESRGDHIV